MSESCKAKCGRPGVIEIKYGRRKKAKVCSECYDRAMTDAKWEFLTADERAEPKKI